MSRRSSRWTRPSLHSRASARATVPGVRPRCRATRRTLVLASHLPSLGRASSATSSRIAQAVGPRCRFAARDSAVTVMAARGSEPWSGCASSVIGQPEAAQELIPRHTDDAAELVVGDAFLSLRQPEDLSLPEGSRTGDSQDPSCLGHGEYWRELIDRQGHTSPDWMPSLRKLPPCDSVVNLSFTRSEMLDYYEQRWTPANSPSTGTSPPTRWSPTTSPGPVKPGAGARKKPAGASSPSSAPAGRRRPSPRPSAPSTRAAAGGSPPTRSW